MPAPSQLRGAVGLVARTFSTPLNDVWDMDLPELMEWAHEAAAVQRRLAGGGR